MRAFVPLARTDWPRVYRWMVAQDFPHVPSCYEEALPYFESVHMWGIKKNSDLVAAFVVGAPDDGVSFLDVVCAPGEEGKWASRPMMKALAQTAFGEMGLRCLWVQAHKKEGLTAALKAGFVPSTPLDCPAPVLALTAFGARRYLET